MTEKSCFDCAYSGRSAGFGTLVCTKFEIPLVQAKSDKLAVKIASECEGFAPTTDRVLPELTGAADPNGLPIGAAPSVARDALSKASQTDRVAHCGSCKYYATPNTVLDAFGFSSGLCLANGFLVNPDRMAAVASNCNLGAEGQNFTASVETIVKLTPKLAVITAGDKPDGPRSGAQDPRHHSKVDPRDWPSDRPVTPDEQACGIRAWRRVSDPKGYGADIFMPIIAWDKILDDNGQRLITEDPRSTYTGSSPWLYTDHGGLLYWVAALTMGGISPTKALNMAVSLRGEAGTGKTEFFVWYAWLMDIPFTRISINPATEAYHLEGRDTFISGPNGETISKYELSRFAKAYSKPGVIVIDEYNAGQNEVQFFMRPIIDGSSQFVVESAGLVFERDPFCFIGFTMNPEDNPAYRGTRPLSEADWDRLRVRKLDVPSEEVEREIIRLHVENDGLDISEKQLDKLMDIGTRIRAKYSNGEIATPWRLRPQIAVAKMLSVFSFEDAFRAAAADRMEDDVAELLMGEVRAVVG